MLPIFISLRKDLVLWLSLSLCYKRSHPIVNDYDFVALTGKYPILGKM